MHFYSNEGFQKAQESLVKNDIHASASYLRQLMTEIKGNKEEQDQFCEIYFQLLKVNPDLESQLSAEYIYSNFAPIQL